MAELRLVFVVGEASGDTLAAEMVDGIRARGHDVTISGIGGRRLQERGLSAVSPMESLTVIGIGQALAAVSRLNRLADQLIAHVIETRPNAIITVDSKGFNLRFARRLRARLQRISPGMVPPVIHTVAPTVWAWGGWRAGGVARSVDRLICLFPFEVPFFTAHGLDTVAAGHPAAERSRPKRPAARARFDITADEKVLCLLPGSRRSEVERVLPDMVEAVRILKKDIPGLRVFLPVAATVATTITPLIAAEDAITPVPQDDLDHVLAAADFGLICSGTVSLEAALSGLPGHVYYRADLISTLIGRLLVRRDRVVLPNVIAGREIYGFSLGDEFNATRMAATARQGLMQRNSDMSATATQTRQQLTVGRGFAATAAEAILEKIGVQPED